MKLMSVKEHQWSEIKEIMSCGGSLSPEESIRSQKYTLGLLFFRLANIKVISEVAV